MSQLGVETGDEPHRRDSLALAKQGDAEEALSRLKDGGYGADHPSVVRATTVLGRAAAEVERLVVEFRSQRATMRGQELQPQGITARPVKELEAEQKELTALQAETAKQLTQLNEKRLELIPAARTNLRG